MSILLLLRSRPYQRSPRPCADASHSNVSFGIGLHNCSTHCRTVRLRSHSFLQATTQLESLDVSDARRHLCRGLLFAKILRIGDCLSKLYDLFEHHRRIHLRRRGLGIQQPNFPKQDVLRQRNDRLLHPDDSHAEHHWIALQQVLRLSKSNCELSFQMQHQINIFVTVWKLALIFLD